MFIFMSCSVLHILAVCRVIKGSSEDVNLYQYKLLISPASTTPNSFLLNSFFHFSFLSYDGDVNFLVITSSGRSATNKCLGFHTYENHQWSSPCL